MGRDRELEQLARAILDARLLTLTGAGGSGKTRLALELVRGRLPDGLGAYWVELAPLRDPGLLAPAIAEAVGLREEVRSGDLDGLARLLHAQDGLLVLDNCEHLVESCAEVTDTLLRECPGLSVLATSREALGVRGERAWLVPPLSLPSEDGSDDPGSAEAVALFVDRARDVVPDFELDGTSTAPVVEICRRLDGIPLAIELAAARVRVLPPREILARLDRALPLLTDGRRTALPRHRTLRAAIDWSHDLLREPGRVLLRRMAVFRGGFTLEAAERVGAGGGIEPGDVLDLIAALVDRSLLVVRELDGFARYHLLEAIRQYATEKLVEAGEEEEVRGRHAAYLLERVEEAEPHFIRTERRWWVSRLQPEMDNLRSALAWSETRDAALHVRLVGKLWWFWFSSQHWTEAGRWIERALAPSEAAGPGLDRARLLFAAGALSALQARTEPARRSLEEAVRLAAAHGDERLEAYATTYLGMTYAGEGRPEGAELCRRGEVWFRSHEDLYGLRLSLLLQGSAAMGRGDLDQAEQLNREGVSVARRFGQDRELAVSLQNLAVVLLVRGRVDEAESLAREALAASRRDPSYYFMAQGIGYLGEIAALKGEPTRAARLFGAAAGLRELIGAVEFRIHAERVAAVVARLREAIGAEAFGRAWAEGRDGPPERLLDELLSDPSPSTSGPGALPATGAVPGGPEVIVETSGGGSSSGLPIAEGAGAVTATATRTPSLEVLALGPLSARVEGVDVPPDQWPYGKPRELLAYLLLNPDGASRDRIGEALWPGAPRSNVKNSFHVSLHHVRKVLGHPEWIVVEGDRYRLAPGLDYRFDVEEFAESVRQARQVGDANALRAAMALYRGELLEGELTGRWLDEYRDHTRRLYLDCGLALGAALEATEPGAAAEVYRGLIAREELDEEAHRRLMTLWAATGERVRALRHFERLEALLLEALDADPEPETMALYHRIRIADAAPTQPSG